MLIYQTKAVTIVWQIEGFPAYGFGKDKRLYNLQRGREVRKVLKGYTLGYNLAGRFYSLNQIRPLLRKPETYCPY